MSFPKVAVCSFLFQVGTPLDRESLLDDELERLGDFEYPDFCLTGRNLPKESTDVDRSRLASGFGLLLAERDRLQDDRLDSESYEKDRERRCFPFFPSFGFDLVDSFLLVGSFKGGKSSTRIRSASEGDGCSDVL